MATEQITKVQETTQKNLEVKREFKTRTEIRRKMAKSNNLIDRLARTVE